MQYPTLKALSGQVDLLLHSFIAFSRNCLLNHYFLCLFK